jgi:hypothetical protein
MTAAPTLRPPTADTTARPAERRRLRVALLLAGVLPALVAVAFLVKVVVMLSHDGDGRALFDEDDYSAAAGEFAANDRLNWFEPWIAPFDEGAARHADGELEAAIGLYDEALEDVPVEEECTVRINQALAYETLGDQAAEAADSELAMEQWQAGIATLAAGDCPLDSGRGEDQTRDAAAVDQRLRDKLERQQQQQQQQQQGQQQDQQQEQQEQQDRQEERLERRNDEAIEEQQDYEDTYGDRDYSEYQW